jgi:hypothetical protein
MMAEISLDQDEINLIMKGLNLLHERRAELSDDEQDVIPVLAFKLGMAAHDFLRENGKPPV